MIIYLFNYFSPTTRTRNTSPWLWGERIRVSVGHEIHTHNKAYYRLELALGYGAVQAPIGSEHWLPDQELDFCMDPVSSNHSEFTVHSPCPLRALPPPVAPGSLFPTRLQCLSFGVSYSLLTVPTVLRQPSEYT